MATHILSVGSAIPSAALLRNEVCFTSTPRYNVLGILQIDRGRLDFLNSSYPNKKQTSLFIFCDFCYLCIVKHSKIKQRIVETASSLFYKNGYNLTGINEIIAEAGIAKATLYSHFKSKEDICLAYLEYKNSTFLEDIGQYCRAQSPGKAQLIAIFDFLYQFFDDRDFNGCWCIRTVSEIPMDNHRIRFEIQEQKKGFIQLIGALVSVNLTDRGEEASVLLAKQLYLLYESAVGESHLHGDRWPIDVAKQSFIQILNS